MKVEVFVEAEVAEQSPEERECALALVNKLGLAKQRPYVSGENRPVAFRRISHEERVAYRLLCPITTRLEEYHQGPIPLRVLEVADTAMASGFFKELVVWHPEDVRVDPILIGHRQNRPEYSWDISEYLLARWGEALDEWPAVVRKALDIAKSKMRALRADFDRAMAIVEAGDLSRLHPAFSPSIYGCLQ